MHHAGSQAGSTAPLYPRKTGIATKGTLTFQDKDGIRIITLVLASARHTTAVGLQATIEGARDRLGSLVGDGALGCRDGKGGTLLKNTKVVRANFSGRGGKDDGSAEDSEGSSELHLDDLFE